MCDDDDNSPAGPAEYPTEDELPDDPVMPEDIDPFHVDPDEFDDINDFVIAEWDAMQEDDDSVSD